MIRVIYIGDHFYWQSGTMMSSIYLENGQRYDWGFMNIDLKNGEEVFIRQATPEERVKYEDALARLRSERAEEAERRA